MKYANRTDVTCDKSRGEIERTLMRYGATGFMYGWQGDNAMVAFEANGRSIKFILPLPNRSDHEFTHHSKGMRSMEVAHNLWEQSCRQRWRALALVIKAKLEAIESGITTFESEFLAHFITSDGRTVGDHIIPQLNDSTTPPRLALLG